MNSMNDKRRRIPSNRSIIRNINNALLIGKNSQSKSKENSSDNAISQKSRLMKYQAESMIRPPVDHQKPQSIYLKLSRHEKELMPNNNNITTYHNIPNAKGINKTAIGTEYNASQKFLRIFPDNIDTRLGIGEMLLNDDSILLTDSNLINDIVPNSVFDSNELSNVKLNFNEWNMKIMSSTNSKKANHIQNSSNPKNKLNEIIANVTPFDNNFQSNKLPLSIPHHQGISITDNGRSNLLTTSTNSNGNVLTTGSKDNKEIKKLNNKSSKNQRNTNRQMQSKNAKTIHNPSFHNESLSGRTTVNSNSNNNSNKTNNNNHYQHVLLYKHKDPFVLNNADSEGGRKNNSKDSRRKLKEKIDSKSKDTVMKYLKILFGEQLESFNEKSIDIYVYAL